MKPLNEEMKYVSDAPEGTNPFEELVQENAKLRAEITSLKAFQNRAEYAERFVEDLKAENAKLRAELAAAREVLGSLVDAVNVEFPGGMKDIRGRTAVALIAAVNALAKKTDVKAIEEAQRRAHKKPLELRAALAAAKEEAKTFKGIAEIGSQHIIATRRLLSPVNRVMELEAGVAAELAAAREDTERLDWADKHLGDYQLKDGSFPFPDHPKSVRAAIDAARKGPQ